MRATVERPVQVATGWGTPGAPAYQPVGAVPCFVTVRDSKEAVDEDKSLVVRRMIGVFPAGADVQQKDRIVSVTDRRGGVVFAGPLYVRAIAAAIKANGRTSHKRAILESKV